MLFFVLFGVRKVTVFRLQTHLSGQNCSSLSVQCSLFDLTASQCIIKSTHCTNYVQYVGGHARKWKVFSKEEHTISTEKVHLQCRQGCGIRISYIISMDEGVQCKTTKTAYWVVGGCIYLDILRTIQLQPRFYLAVIVSRF